MLADALPPPPAPIVQPATAAFPGLDAMLDAQSIVRAMHDAAKRADAPLALRSFAAERGAARRDAVGRGPAGIGCHRRPRDAHFPP